MIFKKFHLHKPPSGTQGPCYISNNDEYYYYFKWILCDQTVEYFTFRKARVGVLGNIIWCPENSKLSIIKLEKKEYGLISILDMDIAFLWKNFRMVPECIGKIKYFRTENALYDQKNQNLEANRWFRMVLLLLWYARNLLYFVS